MGLCQNYLIPYRTIKAYIDFTKVGLFSYNKPAAPSSVHNICQKLFSKVCNVQHVLIFCGSDTHLPS